MSKDVKEKTAQRDSDDDRSRAADHFTLVSSQLPARRAVEGRSQQRQEDQRADRITDEIVKDNAAVAAASFTPQDGRDDVSVDCKQVDDTEGLHQRDTVPHHTAKSQRLAHRGHHRYPTKGFDSEQQCEGHARERKGSKGVWGGEGFQRRRVERVGFWEEGGGESGVREVGIWEGSGFSGERRWGVGVEGGERRGRERGLCFWEWVERGGRVFFVRVGGEGREGDGMFFGEKEVFFGERKGGEGGGWAVVVVVGFGWFEERGGSGGGRKGGFRERGGSGFRERGRRREKGRRRGSRGGGPPGGEREGPRKGLFEFFQEVLLAVPFFLATLGPKEAHLEVPFFSSDFAAR